MDYVLLKGNTEVLPVYAYRDSRAEAVIPEVHQIMPFDELYAHTGCQFQPFNTLYQLYDNKRSGRLEGVTDFLMIPEYLMYKLCGTKAKEFTNATTTGMIDADTLEFDREIISRLGLPEQLFPKLRRPGEVIGEYEGIKVMLCATHDMGSAVEGIPMEGSHLYISSGTWSLLGVKTPKPITDTESRKANYSNEGGVGYNRYQKNIMGMWLVNELRRDLCPQKDFRLIVQEAADSCFNKTVNADDTAFLAPKSMKAAFDAALGDIFTDAQKCRLLNSGKSAFLSAKLWEIFSCLLDSEHTDYDYVSQAIHCMKLEYANGITVAEIARRINLNRSYFSSLFTKQVGVSPQTYLTNLRIEKLPSL